MASTPHPLASRLTRTHQARGTTLEQGRVCTRGASGRLSALTSTLRSSVNVLVVMGLNPRINARCTLYSRAISLRSEKKNTRASSELRCSGGGVVVARASPLIARGPRGAAVPGGGATQQPRGLTARPSVPSGPGSTGTRPRLDLASAAARRIYYGDWKRLRILLAPNPNDVVHVGGHKSQWTTQR
jgi:hypothetical protein